MSPKPLESGHVHHDHDRLVYFAFVHDVGDEAMGVLERVFVDQRCGVAVLWGRRGGGLKWMRYTKYKDCFEEER